MLKPNYHSDLPKLYLTLQEAQALPEYSASLPTGTTIGKRWRRHDGVFDQDFLLRGGTPVWMIGEYIEINTPGRVGIKWYRLCIKVKAESK